MTALWGPRTQNTTRVSFPRLQLPTVGVEDQRTVLADRAAPEPQIPDAEGAGLSIDRVVTTIEAYREVSTPAAERLGERRILVSHRCLPGATLMRVGLLEEAVPELEAARVLMAAERDSVGEAITLLELAAVRMYAADADVAVNSCARTPRCCRLARPPSADPVRLMNGFWTTLHQAVDD